MPDELDICPFERAIADSRGAVLARHNRDHEKQCVKAIRRRSHPAWSRFVCGFTVTA